MSDAKRPTIGKPKKSAVRPPCAIACDRIQALFPPITASLLPAEPGMYQLHLRLAAPTRIVVGRLGPIDFLAGNYLYTGSALGGLRRRIARHLRAEKRRRWHIDYLLGPAEVVAVALYLTRERLECRLHRTVMERLGGQILAVGFGASDCRCPSHLCYLGRLGAEEAIPNWPEPSLS